MDKIQTLSERDCAIILSELNNDKLEWISFTELTPDEGYDPVPMRYSKCMLSSLTPSFKDFLIGAAPIYQNLPARNVVIIRYLPGDFIVPHVDRGNFCYLISVPLQTGPDGITIDGIFYQDEAGMGLPLKRKELWHHVGPVKELRYSLLYLYGDFE